MRATALHLLAGALLAGAVIIPMVAVWYPTPLFEVVGTARLPVFLACVAALLGPFVFKARRAATGGIQLFDLVTAKDIDPRDLARASHPEFQRRPLGSPQYVAALAPTDPAEVQRILDVSLGGGKDLQAYPQHYVAYAQEARNALKRAKPASAARAKDPKALDAYLAASGRSAASVKFLPLRARKRDGIVLLDAVSGTPLAILLIDPW